MQPPAYWWLLALTVLIQGAFFVRFFAGRLRRKGVQPVTRLGACMLAVSCAAGLAYGAVQRDPLFVLGQVCLLPVYYGILRPDHDRNTER